MSIESAAPAFLAALVYVQGCGALIFALVSVRPSMSTLAPRLLAAGLSAALGGALALPAAAGLPLSYLAMWASQTSGLAIVAALHNSTAAKAAAAPPEDVQADLPLEQLCDGYEAHHWESHSNALHAAGMLLVFGLLGAAACGRPRLLAWVPPTWYLFAWVGHFFYQADVPAVFTYGMTLRGWATGEFCSVRALLTGRTVSGPSEIGLTAAMMCVWVGAATLTRSLGRAPAVPVADDKGGKML